MMKMKPQLLTGIVLLLLLPASSLHSCKKTEHVEQNLIIDSTITGNKPPPYNGISETQVNNYINKVYIDLVGREPVSQELSDAAALLKNGGYSETARTQMVSQLTTTEAFYRRSEELLNARVLNAVDSSQIADQLNVYNYALSLAVINGDVLMKALLELEIDRLGLLMTAWKQYSSGTISINEYYRRHLLNSFYDEINMGSENFVKGTFENLYKRLPTQEELASGVGMVDGTPSFLFFINGSSKGDFATIATSSNNFYEGLVLEAYSVLLQRKPSSAEMGIATDALIGSNGNYAALQVQLMVAKEYAGF